VLLLQSGLTPLHVASFMGCMNIVIYLLQHDASPDVPTVRGETPLHLAARANQTDIIRILLRNGAQVDARARVSPLTGCAVFTVSTESQFDRFGFILTIFYINKNVNVRLYKILNRVQKRKSPKVVHRWLCNFDTTLHSNTRVFLYTYYIYRCKNMLLRFYVQ
jgi:ankyrin repeat protein